MLRFVYDYANFVLTAEVLAKKEYSSLAYLEMKRIKSIFEKTQEELQTLNQKITDDQKQLDYFKREIKQMQERLEKDRVALYDGTVTNKRILDAKEQEISALQDRLKKHQASERSLLAQIEAEKERNKNMQQTMRIDYEKFYLAKEKFEEIKREFATQIEEIKQKMEQLRPKIDAATFAWYEKEKDKFMGQPVAILNAKGVCSGCHTHVTANFLNKVKEQDEIIRCERCSRTFVYDEQ